MSVTLIKRDGYVIDWKRNPSQVIEGRTIRSLTEMHAFLDACAAKTGAVRLARPIDVRMVAIALADGSTDYELIAREW